MYVIFCGVSYRKVAADQCTDTTVTSKYDPVPATCPLIAPHDLSLEVIGGDVVAVGTNVTFHLTQEEVNERGRHLRKFSPLYLNYLLS